MSLKKIIGPILVSCFLFSIFSFDLPAQGIDFDSVIYPQGVKYAYDHAGLAEAGWPKYIAGVAAGAFRGMAPRGYAKYMAGSSSSPAEGGLWFSRFDCEDAALVGGAEEKWYKTFGSGSDDHPTAVTYDRLGVNYGVYVVGWTTGDLFAANAGGQDIFIAKFDSTGKFIWGAQKGTKKDEIPLSVIADRTGNVFIASTGYGDLARGKKFGGRDVFLAKYSKDGKELWTRGFGSEGDDSPIKVAVDGQGNSYVTGYVYSAVDELVIGAVVDLHPDADCFVQAFDPAGKVLWHDEISSTGNEFGLEIKISEKTHNIFVAGYTDGDLLEERNHGNGDLFVAMYSQEGDRIWLNQTGTQANDILQRLLVMDYYDKLGYPDAVNAVEISWYADGRNKGKVSFTDANLSQIYSFGGESIGSPLSR